MAATSIYFNGRRIVVPQAVTKVDASALQASSPGAVGIVALIGTAEGGVPLTCDEQYDLTRPETAQTQYRSGDLRTAALFCFEPSLDEAVGGGASKIVPIKVNPATQSTAQLADAVAAASVDLTSIDYGQFTEQINIDVDTGTTQGKLITITFEGTVETIDDVGGDPIFDVLYTPGADGYSTITGAITSTHFTAAATKAEAGLTAEMTATAPAGLPSAIRVVSANAGDTTQTITVYGLVGAVPYLETVTLNGTTPVLTSRTDWTTVLGVVKSAATLGTITVSDTGPNTIASLTAGVLTRGMVLTTNTPVADTTLTVAIDVNAAVDVVIAGTSTTGAVVLERFDMTAGAGGVAGASTFRTITAIALGEVAGARTITVSTNAVRTAHSTFPTVQRLVDRLNSLDGFTATALATDAAEFLMANADYLAAISMLSVTAEFTADLQRFIEGINANSQFVEASRATAATRVPANTASPVYLSGGSEGTTTITQWQEAFTLLQRRRVNIIVPLTRDPAVHSLLLSHLRARAGRLRSEANGYVGIGTGTAGAALSAFRSEIRAINSRHISAISQEMERFDPLTGEATWYPPFMLAAIAAGMQAGSAIAEPLTRKLLNVLDIRNDSSWSVEDDIDLMIDSGAMVAESVDTVGIRWVRSVTTHLQSSNAAYTEMSTNESLDHCVYRLRTAIDEKIGDRALANSAGQIKGIAADELDRLVADEVIVAWKTRSLRVDQIGDVFPTSVEVAPVNPINFVPITVHLVPYRASA